MTFTAGQKVRTSDLNNLFHRVGSVVDASTSALAVTTTEAIVGSTLTVSLTNGRKYRIGARVVLNCSLTSINGFAVLCPVRYASGSSVTTAGTLLFNIELAHGTAGLNETLAYDTEKAWSGATGTYTFGIGAQIAINTGSPTVKYGGGATQPAMIYVDDLGS